MIGTILITFPGVTPGSLRAALQGATGTDTLTTWTRKSVSYVPAMASLAAFGSMAGGIGLMPIGVWPGLTPSSTAFNNHHRLPFPGEDFQTWEKDLPGQRTVSFNQEAQVGQLPLESSNTINGSWGYNKSDKEFKSTRELLHYLIRAGGFNSNFLLDVAVMPGGKIQPEFIQRLKEMGRWLAANGESIYGTRGGPLSPRPWGVTTRKGNIFYIHILDWKDNVLALPKLPAKVKAAWLLKDGRRVEFADLGYGFVLNLPRGSLDPIDTIVVLETVGEDEDKS